MSLSAEAQVELVNAILDGYSFNGLRVMMMKPPVDYDPERIATGEGMDLLVPLIVAFFDRKGWTDRLVEGVYNDAPENAQIKTFHAWYTGERLAERATVTSGDRFQAHRLTSNRLFLGRKALRAVLSEVLPTSGPAVFRVSGKPATGKSHTRFLIEHLAEGAYTVHVLDLEALLDRGAKAVAADFLMQIGADVRDCPEPPQPADASTELRWARPLAHCICDQILRQGKPRWLIFDHFNKPGVTVPDDTGELIAELTKRAEGDMHALLRVALLDFEGTLPPEVSDVAPHEEVQLFGPDDMVTVYKLEASSRGIAIGETDEHEVASAVQRLWAAHKQDPTVNPKEQLRYLVREFNTLLKTLQPTENGG